jgi:hypothetical protein
MAERPRKITIGFAGGQTLGARVAPDALDKLQNALPAGGWHELKAEDGVVHVDLAQVSYVITDTDEHRVGF